MYSGAAAHYNLFLNLRSARLQSADWKLTFHAREPFFFGWCRGRVICGCGSWRGGGRKCEEGVVDAGVWQGIIRGRKRIKQSKIILSNVMKKFGKPTPVLIERNIVLLRKRAMHQVSRENRHV